MLRCDRSPRYSRSLLFSRALLTITSVAVLRDGKVVEQRALGLASIELDPPVRPDTVFILASLTKTFTAAAILALADDGKLALSDSVAKYVRGLSETWIVLTNLQGSAPASLAMGIAGLYIPALRQPERSEPRP